MLTGLCVSFCLEKKKEKSTRRRRRSLLFDLSLLLLSLPDLSPRLTANVDILREEEEEEPVEERKRRDDVEEKEEKGRLRAWETDVTLCLFPLSRRIYRLRTRKKTEGKISSERREKEETFVTRTL